jgi:FkbM family methyltransferase
MSFNEIVPTIWGQVIVNKNDTIVGRCLREYGEFGEEELELLRMLTPVGSTFIDVGANFGSMTIPMAKHVGDGMVIAFEPQRHVFQALCGSIALNGLKNVHAFQQCLGTERLIREANRLDPNAANSFGGFSPRMDFEGAREEIDQFALDDLPTEWLENVSMIKIDVEGMEADVVRGAERTLLRYRPLLYVENDRVERSAELISLIMSFGYDLYWDWSRLVRKEKVREDDTFLGNLASYMMICFPSEMKATINLEPVLDANDNPVLAVERQKARGNV